MRISVPGRPTRFIDLGPQPPDGPVDFWSSWHRYPRGAQIEAERWARNKVPDPPAGGPRISTVARAIAGDVAKAAQRSIRCGRPMTQHPEERCGRRPGHRTECRSEEVVARDNARRRTSRPAEDREP
jgi:hypothetical protein